MNKKSYFQGGGGVNEPKPKKKKYKSDDAIVVQPRFEEPFYSNYDLYDVGDTGPGTRLKKKKKIYKANDSYFSNGKIKKRKSALRKIFFGEIIKSAMDFVLDNQIDSSPIIGNYDTSYEASVPTGAFDGMQSIDIQSKNNDMLSDKVYDTSDEEVEELSPDEIQEIIDRFNEFVENKDFLSTPINNEDNFYNKNLFYGITNIPKSKLNAI